MPTIVLIIGICFWLLYKFGGERKEIHPWIWKGVGLFLLFVVIQNLSEFYQFIIKESDAWWPLIKENAHRLADGIRNLITVIMKGNEN